MKLLRSIVQQLSCNAYIFFPLAFILLFIFYFPAHNGMLIDDGISGLWEMKTQGIKGFFNSYGTHEFYYGHYAILFILYKLFGLNSTLWFAFFIFMHVLNAWLINKFLQRLLAVCDVQPIHLISFLSTILFLFSPYMNENITWAATSHYAISLSIFLFSLKLLINYFETGKATNLYFLHAFHAIALVTLEIAFFFPLVYALLFILLFVLNKNVVSVKKFLIGVLIPLSIIIGAYLFFYKIKNGIWIPNRGYDNPTSIQHYVTSYGQHILKLFGLVHYASFKQREWIYTLCLHWKKLIFILLGLFSLLAWFTKEKGKNVFLLFLFLLVSGLIIDTPFLKNYFMFLFQFENDRYQYFLSVFYLPMFVLLCLQLHKYIAATVIFVWLSVGLLYEQKAISSKQEASELYNHYIENFPVCKPNQKIYVLNVPNYCNNHYQFRANYRLPISLQMFRGIDTSVKIIPVGYYYAPEKKCQFESYKKNDSTLILTSKTNGVWWMYESIGASNYENEDYKATFNGNQVEVIFKHALKPNEKIVCYNDGFYDLK